MTYQVRSRHGWYAAGGGLVATLAVVAGSLAASGSPAFGWGTPPTSTTPDDLAHAQAWGAHQIRERVDALEWEIRQVEDDNFVGSDGTTLVADMQADITGLGSLGATIAADTTLNQVNTDNGLIFSDYRVYDFMLPLVKDVVEVDDITNVKLPALATAITNLTGEENSSNQSVLAPLVSNMQSQGSTATTATSGLSAELLGYTLADWNSNHALLKGAGTGIFIADRAIRNADKDVDQANEYLSWLRNHCHGFNFRHGRCYGKYPTTTTTTVPPTTTTTVPPATTTTVAPTTTTTVAPTTTTTAPSFNCSAPVIGTVLSRTGWVASTNAPSSSSDAPANALDGNLNTRFSTDEDQAPGLYFEVDMGSSATFEELLMDVPNSPHDYARGYDIEASTNGTSWTTVASCTGTGTPEIVSFPAQTAQYVKVVLTASNPTWWWSIDEFYLNGNA